MQVWKTSIIKTLIEFATEWEKFHTKLCYKMMETDILERQVYNPIWN